MKIALFAVVSCCCAIARSDVDRPPSGFNRTFFVSEIFHKYGNRDYMTYEGFEHLLENLGLGRLKFDISHDVSLHKINGTFREFHDELKLHKHNHSMNSTDRNLTKRNVLEYERIDSSERRTRCLTPQDLLSTYGLETSHGVVISRKGFLDMCPAIVYELDQKACRPEIAMIESPKQENESHLVWLYATLSIFIMSVAGLLCILLVPAVVQDCYKPFLDFLIATGVGTLCGDALLHLLPHVLVHRIEEESKAQPILRGTFTILSIFFFFVIETLLKFIQTQKVLKETINDELGKMITDQREMQDNSNSGHQHFHGGHGKNNAIASMVIIGDVLHNVTDGLSIGAAFASSISSGFASSIAIFSHELPHELGDYATLISSGMSRKKTILYNVLSSIFSFLGMIVGIFLGEIKHVSLWINAFTAGSFLYIALSDLVPEMKLCHAENRKARTMIIHISGLICGGVIMFCVALFEENLETLLK